MDHVQYRDLILESENHLSLLLSEFQDTYSHNYEEDSAVTANDSTHKLFWSLDKARKSVLLCLDSRDILDLSKRKKAKLKKQFYNNALVSNYSMRKEIIEPPILSHNGSNLISNLPFREWLHQVFPTWKRTPHYEKGLKILLDDSNREGDFLRQSFKGYYHIYQYLKQYHPNYVYITLGGYSSPIQWLYLLGQNIPSYSYPDTPLPGWRKDVCIRQGEKLLGSIEVVYLPPTGTKRLRGKSEILTYLQHHSLSSHLLTKLDTRPVYCICHQSQTDYIKGRNEYLECSYGKAGCHGWVHPDCVGLNHMSEQEIRQLDAIICPFCTVYLEGAGLLHLHNDKMCLRTISFPSTTTHINFKGFSIIESADMPSEWKHLNLPIPTSVTRSSSCQSTHTEKGMNTSLQLSTNKSVSSSSNHTTAVVDTNTPLMTISSLSSSLSLSSSSIPYQNTTTITNVPTATSSSDITSSASSSTAILSPSMDSSSVVNRHTRANNPRHQRNILEKDNNIPNYSSYSSCSSMTKSMDNSPSLPIKEGMFKHRLFQYILQSTDNNSTTTTTDSITDDFIVTKATSTTLSTVNNVNAMESKQKPMDDIPMNMEIEEMDMYTSSLLQESLLTNISDNMDTSHEKNMDTSHEKNMTTSHEKNMDTSHEKNMDTSHEKNMDTSHEKNMDTSHEKNMDTSHENNMTSTSQQTQDLSLIIVESGDRPHVTSFTSTITTTDSISILNEDNLKMNVIEANDERSVESTASNSDNIVSISIKNHDEDEAIVNEGLQAIEINQASIQLSTEKEHKEDKEPSEPSKPSFIINKHQEGLELEECTTHDFVPLNDRYRRDLIDYAYTYSRDIYNTYKKQKKQRIESNTILNTTHLHVGCDNSMDGLKSTTDTTTAVDDMTSESVHISLMSEPPILSYLPVENHTVSVCCFFEGNMCHSVHGLCQQEKLCGYCLEPLHNDTIKTQYDIENPNHKDEQNKSSHSSKKTKRASSQGSSSKKKKATELDTYSTAVSSFGKVSYKLHAACTYQVEQTSLNLSTTLLSSNSSDVPVSASYTSTKDHTAINSTTNTNSTSTEDNISGSVLYQQCHKSTSITLSHLYAYEEEGDADCDICGRIGGVLYYFYINTCTQVSAPSNEGWLGHVPCIYWLLYTHITDKIQIILVGNTVSKTQGNCSLNDQVDSSDKSLSSEYKGENEKIDVTVNKDNDDDVNLDTLNIITRQNIETVKDIIMIDDAVKDSESLIKVTDDIITLEHTQSYFEKNYKQWRCILCGTSHGICIRCCAPSCTIRAHPICIQHAMFAGYQLHLATIKSSVNSLHSSDHNSDDHAQFAIFLCSFHSNISNSSNVI